MSATFYVLQTTKLNLKEARRKNLIDLTNLVVNQVLELPQAYAIDFFALDLDGISHIEDEDLHKEDLERVFSQLDNYDELILNAAFVNKREYVLTSDKDTVFKYGPASANSPLHLAAYLEEASDDILSTIEHSFIIEDEQARFDNSSLVYYYGYHDEKPYRGLIEEVEIKEDELTDFELSPLAMTVFIYDFEVTEDSLQIISSYADSYEEYNVEEEELFDSNFVVEDGRVHYYLNGPEINSKEELDKFINLTSQLIINMKPFSDQEDLLVINPVFLDLANDLPKKVRIEFDDKGDHKLYVTSL